MALISSFETINDNSYYDFDGGSSLKLDAKDRFFIYEKGQRVSLSQSTKVFLMYIGFNRLSKGSLI